MNRKEIRVTYGETVRSQNDWAAECEKRNVSVVERLDWHPVTGAAPVQRGNCQHERQLQRHGSGTVTLANGEVR